jgi:hypothetical protein
MKLPVGRMKVAQTDRGEGKMAKHRIKEEKLKRIRLGSRYVGLDLGQFYWECLKLAAASEDLTETDILRRIIRSWSETLPPAIQEKARTEAAQLEAWKAQQLRAREDAKRQAKKAKIDKLRAKLHEERSPQARGRFLRRRERISASN